MQRTVIAGDTENPCNRGGNMLAQVQAHLEACRIDAATLFRAAYMARFQRDEPAGSLAQDVEDWNRRGAIPPYVRDYMLSTVGDIRKRVTP